MSSEVLDEGRRRFIGASLVAVPGAAFGSGRLLASREASAQTRSADTVKQPAVIGYLNKKGLQIERGAYAQLFTLGVRLTAQAEKDHGEWVLRCFSCGVVTIIRIS